MPPVTLGPAAHIGGDLVTVGATLDRAETAQVDGQIYNTATSWSEASNGDQPLEPVIPEPEVTTPEYTFNFNPFRYFWDVVGNAIFLGLLAMLLMLFLARQAENVAQAAVKQTLTAGGLGLLTVIVAPFAIVLLAITIVLIPGRRCWWPLRWVWRCSSAGLPSAMKSDSASRLPSTGSGTRHYPPVWALSCFRWW